jgi:hypothetical protein
MPNRKVVVGVAWFRPQDWNRLLELSEDRDGLEDSHGAWRDSANRLIRELERGGIHARRVVIDLDELVAWCKEQNRPLNGAARADFTSKKVRIEENR